MYELPHKYLKIHLKLSSSYVYNLRVYFIEFKISLLRFYDYKKSCVVNSTVLPLTFPSSYSVSVYVTPIKSERIILGIIPTFFM